MGDTPKGVDILMGLDIQDVLGTVIDRPASTIMFDLHKVNVKTDRADTASARMRVECERHPSQWLQPMLDAISPMPQYVTLGSK